MTYPTTVTEPRAGAAATRPRTRALTVLAVGLLTIVALAGCMKIDMDLTIKDDTVSGTMILAFDKELLTLTGQSEEQMLASLTQDNGLPEGAGVTSERYSDDKFIGTRFILSDVSLDTFTDAESEADSLRITHDKDAGVYRVNGAMDFSDTGEIPPTMASVMDSLEIRIAITFPGEVIQHTGELDGTTVTWRPKVGETTPIEAEAKDSSTSLPVALAIGGSLLVVLAVILVVVFILLRRRPAAGDPAAGGTAAGGTEGPAPQGSPPPGATP